MILGGIVMSRKDEFFEKAFVILEQDGIPTEEQKAIMLNRIIMECKVENTSGIGRLKKMVITYPWRFAFTASAIQAVIFTTIFGTQYTNLLLNFFGG